MPTKITPDATIHDVLPTLTRKDAYVRGVYQKLHMHPEELHSRLSVRIGVQGTGQKPYYRIVLDGQSGATDTDEQILGAYYDNGETLETSAASNKQWSTKITPYAEVEGLLKTWRDERKARSDLAKARK